MKKGALIGHGMTAEVFEWGKDRVLKLFFGKYDDERVLYEAKIASLVHDAGVPSPEVFEIIDLSGRKGIIFQRIFGRSLSIKIQEEPWKLEYYTQMLAKLQFTIHQYTSDGLPSQKDRLSLIIGKSAKILGEKEKIIVDYLESLPDGDSICHGDLHFNNVMVSDDKLIAVDWNSSYRGNPLGDVARTCLMISSPKIQMTSLNFMTNLTEYTKWLSQWSYLNEYMALSKVKYDNIDDWILPIAAGKLKDKVNGDQKRLMDIIDERIELLHGN